MSGRGPVEYRDETLGAYLRALQAPEHRPGFDAEMPRVVTRAADI